MAYADQAGRARLDPQRPQAQAVCDGCGCWFSRIDLRMQMEFRGDSLQDTGFRYCYRCLSQPQPQLKTVILPEDPYPIVDPRVEYFLQDQNLNGFTQFVGPQGTSIYQPVVTELDPTNPLTSKAAVLASAGTGWGLPRPAVADRGGVIRASGVSQQIMPSNATRSYLLIYNPYGGVLAAAQGTSPTLGISASNLSNLYDPVPIAETGTIIAGIGQGILQNSFASPPATMWTGAVNVLGLVAGAQFFAWEGATNFLTNDDGTEVLTDDNGEPLTNDE